MAIQSVAMKAYEQAVGQQKQITRQIESYAPKNQPEGTGFTDTLTDSLKKVNDMQGEKASMIEAFASGETSNVHELMISLQKASVAMSVTTAVRSKIMHAYNEIMRMQI